VLHDLFQEPVGLFLLMVAIILVAPLLSQWARLPSIVGLIAGGWLIGPYGLGLLEREGVVKLLATVGLIYLMFSAGAEIDLVQFNRVKGKSLLFGLLTFSIPQVTGILLGRVFGYSLLSSILLGSVFASHTLIAFPIISKLGIARNESVAVTVGATILTDIGALLVLAAVAGAESGSASPLFFARLIGLLAVYTVVILFGLPRLGRWFFRRFRTVSVEFQFVLVAIFVAAFFAELIGVEAIVGAFLAGLAINATLPHQSAVMSRVLFIGEAFFIPIFLLSIGMILDLRVFLSDPRALLVGGLLVVAIYLTKLAASTITGLIFKYKREDVLTMWGLSQAQAAATLAAALVGLQIGLFDRAVFNGVILMILTTCITSPIIVQRFGPILAARKTTQSAITVRPGFSRVLVPVANPHTEEHLIGLASLLTRAEDGLLMPIYVALNKQGVLSGLTEQHDLLEATFLQGLEVKTRPIYRVDTSVAGGVLNAAVQHNASAIVLGWGGKPGLSANLFGRLLDEIVANAHVPVLVSRIQLPINSHRRLVLVMPANSVTTLLIDEIVSLAKSMVGALNVPLLIVANYLYEEDLKQFTRQMDLTCSITGVDVITVDALLPLLKSADLVLIATGGSAPRFQSSLGKLPEDLTQKSVASVVTLRYPLEPGHLDTWENPLTLPQPAPSSG